MASGVYVITNKKNGKVYIGSTNDFERRWGEHKDALCKGVHGNGHLQGAWDIYGEIMFEFGILEYLDNFEELPLAEQFWMDLYREGDKELYNIALTTDCPMRGRKMSEESRRKMSKSQKGKIVSKETRRKLSEAMKGKPGTNLGKKFSEEHKRKMSEAQKGRKHSKETRRKMSAAAQNCSEETRRRRSEAHKGKKHSEETRRKMSESHKGRPGAMLGRKCGPLSKEHRRKISNTLMGHSVSDEARRRISEGHRGKKHSEEHKRKIAESNKGGKRTEEQRRRMSDAQKLRRAKERNDDKD